LYIQDFPALLSIGIVCVTEIYFFSKSKNALMTDTSHQGVMAMVKIDGSKVKFLREQKGLTQLYVATVVQVTTDTISRWENKRYPTIKKENALRLAEALEVDIFDIIEESRDEDPETLSAATETTGSAKSTKSFSKIWPLLLLAATVGILIAAVAWFFLMQGQPLKITAKRMLPERCTTNTPFPVSIEVIGPPEAVVAIILKENLPQHVIVKNTDPPLAPSGQKNNTLKWLHKAEGRTLFTYTATLSSPLSLTDVFSGSAAASNDSGNPVTIEGNNTIELGLHHWADSDGDNIISDKEILTVYDQYGDLEKLGIDIDLIEEIWLGSGYRWDPEKNIYEILP
jgi:transcriptional regulator with XRE-family HTH domain